MGNAKLMNLKQTQDRKLMWFMRMQRLSASSIRWSGLPKYLDITWLEQCLTRSGSAIIVRDDVTGRFYVGQNASCGPLDIDGYPIYRSLIFRNGKQIWATSEESVIIYNNPLRTGDYWMYEIIADEMCNIDMAVRVNISTQKTMPIIPIKENQLLSAKNLMYEREMNEPYRFVDPNGLNVDAFARAMQFDNRKSFTADNMIAVQRELWNRALTIIGINNANVEKRERVNIAEANSNLDEIAIIRRDRLNSRDFACGQMKLLWNMDVSANYYSNLRVAEGGDGNGKVYDSGTDDSSAEMD